MRRILYISGTRADYGPAREVLLAMNADPALELGVLVCGMHLDPVHGESWKEIAADGFEIVRWVHGRAADDTLVTMAASTGLLLDGIGKAISELRPDVVLVLGDRGEQLAGAMAAAFQNIVVAHLCGGSISGSIDESIRHAITKFAHYHLPASSEHARRIRQMGEHPDRIRVVGLPGGNLQAEAIIGRDVICADFGLPVDPPYLLVVQHSVTHESAEAGAQMVETMEAVASLPYPTLLANPNDDAGGRAILKIMGKYAAEHQHLRILPPVLSRQRFASLMTHAGAQIGNSSSGIVEAMSVHLPVVNIGERQRGREHLACLLNVPHDRKEICQAVQTALHDAEYRHRLAEFHSPLIRPDTPALVSKALCEIDLNAARHPKPFIDLSVEP